MKQIFEQLVDRFGIYILIGFLGTLIQSIRHKITIKEFFGLILISSFVGYCSSVLMEYYLELDKEIIYVLCSILSSFSNFIMKELEEIISMLSEWVKKKLGI